MLVGAAASRFLHQTLLVVLNFPPVAGDQLMGAVQHRYCNSMLPMAIQALQQAFVMILPVMK